MSDLHIRNSWGLFYETARRVVFWGFFFFPRRVVLSLFFFFSSLRYTGLGAGLDVVRCWTVRRWR
jgi:hypothetical protein